MKKIFLDFEAECMEKKRYKNNHPLQLSAIYFNENNNEVIFNEYFYFEKISNRISNLLKKPRDFYKNENFMQEKEVILKFSNFAKGAELYSFGNFDNIVLKACLKRTKLSKRLNLKLIDAQKLICGKLKVKDISLKKLIQALDINIKLNHDPLEDARALSIVFNKVWNNDYDPIKVKNNLEKLKFLPERLSSEFANYLKVEEPKLQQNFKIIIIRSKEKEIEKQEEKINNDEDVFLSDLMSSEIENLSKTKYKTLDIVLTIFDNECKEIENKKWTLEEIKNDDNKVNWVLPDELGKIIRLNKDNLFIVENKQILSYFASIYDILFVKLSLSNLKNEINNLKKLRMKIIESIDEFDDNEIHTKI